jgi:hypothetical protein
MNRSYFVGFIAYGCSYPGHFLLKVSSEGFQSYERPITFTEGLVACELTLQPKDSRISPEFEMLAELHGRVVDQEGKPYGGAQIEATNERGRLYQDYSNEGGYYSVDLPKGLNTLRITGQHQSLNLSVCKKCKPSE